jgi:hypothetical protein
MQWERSKFTIEVKFERINKMDSLLISVPDKLSDDNEYFELDNAA